MSRIAHFEIPADDPERALGFYRSVFGWKADRWDGPMEYWLLATGPDGVPGINGGLSRRRQPGEGPVNTIRVASLDETLAKLAGAGGTVTAPKSPIPGVGWIAYALDTEGNPFGIMQDDPNAA